MNIRCYVDHLKKWVQISSDETLNKNNNLSDLADKDEAVNNLGIYDKFVSKEALESGFLPDVFTPSNVATDADHQFVSEEEKTAWNNKLNRPTVLTENLPDFQLGYDSSSERFYIGMDGKNTLFGGKSALDNIKVVASNFSGNGEATVIRNTQLDSNGNLLKPLFVDVTPIDFTDGQLGEISVSFDTASIKVYNTGSFTGLFECLIVYPLGE